MESTLKKSKFEHKMVEMCNITKKFDHFVANESLNLTVYKGEVHAILGENGAGKTTLMKILYGLYQPTDGEIFIDGKKVDINHTDVAISLGIGMVHQHFMLIPPFTVTENIVLGKEPIKSLDQLDIKKAEAEVKALSEKYKLVVDPKARICDLSVGVQQRVEILKALYRGADILILDEPTAVLTPPEVVELQNIVKSLVEVGKSVIIITHKLKEIKMMADRCTIIRKGKFIDCVNVEEIDENQLAAKMVGRDVNFNVQKKELNPGDIALKINNVVAKNNRGIDILNGINIEVRKGEIFGIAGVDGNGQMELVEVLSGIRKAESGTISVQGVDITNKPPKKILENKISFIPEDRIQRGLVQDFTAYENLVLQNYNKSPYAKGINLKKNNMIKLAQTLIKQFDVRPDDPEALAGSLSGGNQQKLIIAREISNDPDVLVASQPTRGLDVGAIEFVHKSLINQRDRGKAVLLISFELDEIMALSDRIGVIYEGKIVKVINAKEATENNLGFMMSGGREQA